METSSPSSTSSCCGGCATALPFGLVAGIGFLQREFTAYGVVALLALSFIRRPTVGRPGRSHWLRAAAGFLAVLAVVELLRPLTLDEM